jgi:hypothetical protein
MKTLPSAYERVVTVSFTNQKINYKTIKRYENSILSRLPGLFNIIHVHICKKNRSILFLPSKRSISS